MNLLADPLVISATHTIGSGLVIIAGDDLGPRFSQAEMDSRFYGPLSEIPMLDPNSPAALHASILESFALSERLRIPVIVRVTARLLADEGAEILPRPNKGTAQQFEKGALELTMRGRHQRHHDRILADAEDASESTSLNRLEISGDVGIIAGGRPAALPKAWESRFSLWATAILCLQSSSAASSMVTASSWWQRSRSPSLSRSWH